MIDLSLQEMDAFLLAIERKQFPEDQKVLFESGMDKIRAGWVEGIKRSKGTSHEEIAKLVARDPDSPFRGMVDMSEANVMGDE